MKRNLLIVGVVLLSLQAAVYAENPSLSYQEKKDIICTECFNNNAEKCELADIKKTNVNPKYSLYLAMKAKSKKEFPHERDLFYFQNSDIENLIYNADQKNYKAIIKAVNNDWCYKKGELYAGNIFTDNNDINYLNGQDLTDFLELLNFKYKTPFTKEQAAELISISTQNDEETKAFMDNMNNPLLAPELIKNLDLVRLLISKDLYCEFEHYNLHYSDMDKLLSEFPMRNKILLYMFLKKQDSKNKNDIIRILYKGPYYYRLNEKVFESEENLPDIKLYKTDVFQLYPKNIYNDYEKLKTLILYANQYNYDGTMICDMWQITNKMENFSAIADDLDDGVFKYYYDNFCQCSYSGYLEDYKLYKIMKNSGFIKENQIRRLLEIKPEPCKTVNKMYYGSREEKLKRILAREDLSNEEKISEIANSFKYRPANPADFVKSYTTKSPPMQFLRLDSSMP